MGANNFVLLSGNVIEDPEIRISQNGKEWVLFCISVSQGKDKDTGEYKSQLINLKGFEGCAKFLKSFHIKKGDAITVQGELEIKCLENAQSGKKIWVTTVIVHNCSAPPKAWKQKNERPPLEEVDPPEFSCVPPSEAVPF